MWFLFIQCCLYYFYNKIRIIIIKFAWPYIHLDSLREIQLHLKYCISLWVSKI